MAGLVAGLMLSVAIEVAQAFSFSRTADTTDLLMNAIGVLLGVALAARWSDGVMPALHAGPRVQVWPIAALAVWCVTLGDQALEPV